MAASPRATAPAPSAATDAHLALPPPPPSTTPPAPTDELTALLPLVAGILAEDDTAAVRVSADGLAALAELRVHCGVDRGHSRHSAGSGAGAPAGGVADGFREAGDAATEPPGVGAVRISTTLLTSGDAAADSCVATLIRVIGDGLPKDSADTGAWAHAVEDAIDDAACVIWCMVRHAPRAGLVDPSAHSGPATTVVPSRAFDLLERHDGIAALLALSARGNGEAQRFAMESLGELADAVLARRRLPVAQLLEFVRTGGPKALKLGIMGLESMENHEISTEWRNDESGCSGGIAALANSIGTSNDTEDCALRRAPALIRGLCESPAWTINLDDATSLINALQRMCDDRRVGPDLARGATQGLLRAMLALVTRSQDPAPRDVHVGLFGANTGAMRSFVRALNKAVSKDSYHWYLALSLLDSIAADVYTPAVAFATAVIDDAGHAPVLAALALLLNEVAAAAIAENISARTVAGDTHGPRIVASCDATRSLVTQYGLPPTASAAHMLDAIVCVIAHACRSRANMLEPLSMLHHVQLSVNDGVVAQLLASPSPQTSAGGALIVRLLAEAAARDRASDAASRMRLHGLWAEFGAPLMRLVASHHAGVRSTSERALDSFVGHVATASKDMARSAAFLDSLVRRAKAVAETSQKLLDGRLVGWAPTGSTTHNTTHSLHPHGEPWKGPSDLAQVRHLFGFFKLKGLLPSLAMAGRWSNSALISSGVVSVLRETAEAAAASMEAGRPVKADGGTDVRKLLLQFMDAFPNEVLWWRADFALATWALRPHQRRPSPSSPQGVAVSGGTGSPANTSGATAGSGAQRVSAAGCRVVEPASMLVGGADRGSQAGAGASSKEGPLERMSVWCSMPRNVVAIVVEQLAPMPPPQPLSASAFLFSDDE